ncbi:MAG: uroporphyrinogen decarboxylase family protein [Spirochaetales bacterium]|nr:uroporphyrinogen decarboxylase family protein [Spirochaetales bacterium]
MELNRQQYLDYMTFKNAERPILVELFGPLIGLPEEWKAQGASEDEIGMEAFGFDYVRKHNVDVNTFLLDQTEEVILEENEEYILTRDSMGRTMKMVKATATLPLPLDHPVTDMESWLKIKPRYEFRADRLASDWLEKAESALASDSLIVAEIPGGFDEPRQLLGEENLCYAYYEQPELIHDILRTIGDTAYKVLDMVSSAITIDQLSVHEDMAGKSGCLIGPAQIDEFMKPYYRKVWDLLESRGTKMFRQDSDGNMNSVIDSMLAAGVTEMYPMEPAAGMDIVEVRKKYGKRLALSGGIDKHVLRQSKAAIRKELEYKLQPAMREGGMVFGLDHRIPNGTPLENYRYYVKTAREILGLEENPESGWARMAF